MSDIVILGARGEPLDVCWCARCCDERAEVEEPDLQTDAYGFDTYWEHRAFWCGEPALDEIEAGCFRDGRPLPAEYEHDR